MSSIIQYRCMRPWLYPNLMFRLLGLGKEHDTHLQILHNMSNRTIKARKRAAHQDKNPKDVVNQEEQTLGRFLVWHCGRGTGFGPPKKLQHEVKDLCFSYGSPTDSHYRPYVGPLRFLKHCTILQRSLYSICVFIVYPYFYLYIFMCPDFYLTNVYTY